MSTRFNYLQLNVAETVLEIKYNPSIARSDLINYCYEKIKQIRGILEKYLEIDPDFEKALSAYSCYRDAPLLIQKMSQISQKTNVGPMASVAGIIADELAALLLNKYKFSELIIGNGGDIFIKTPKEVIIDIYAGTSPLSNQIAIIYKSNLQGGVCTSAGSNGHSFSFGKADCVVIIGDCAAIADAYATYYANRIQKKDDLKIVVEDALKKEEIRGVLAIMSDQLAVGGDIWLINRKKEAIYD